jgi:hypothetical protein
MTIRRVKWYDVRARRIAFNYLVARDDLTCWQEEPDPTVGRHIRVLQPRVSKEAIEVALEELFDGKYRFIIDNWKPLMADTDCKWNTNSYGKKGMTRTGHLAWFHKIYSIKRDS